MTHNNNNKPLQERDGNIFNRKLSTISITHRFQQKLATKEEAPASTSHLFNIETQLDIKSKFEAHASFFRDYAWNLP